MSDPQTTSQPPQDSEGGHGSLTLWIAISIVAALVFALVAPTLFGHEVGKESKTLQGIVKAFDIGGTIFLDVLKMMVVPLVVSSVMAGILNLGDVRKLGKPGGYAILYYLSTTLLAVVTGLLVVSLIRPGVSEGTPEERKAAAEAELDPEASEELNTRLEKANSDEVKDVGDIIGKLVKMLFTSNLLKSAVESDLLPLIVFAIVFAGLLTTMGERVDNITRLVDQINHAFMAFVLLIMKFAPLGIFCLVAGRFTGQVMEGKFLAELQRISWYIGTVLAGLGVHAFLTIPLIFWVFRRENPYRFMYLMGKPLLTAFSTASSSATLPVTMETAVDNAGVSERSVEFVLPLGATINMDGTALYESVAAIFIAQAIGMDLSMLDQLIIVMTATLGAIGAAGIPEAGLITLTIVLAAVGIDPKYAALILSVDWLLDRFRTAVNVFGDSVGAAIIQDAFPPDDDADTIPVPVHDPTPNDADPLN